MAGDQNPPASHLGASSSVMPRPIIHSVWLALMAFSNMWRSIHRSPKPSVTICQALVQSTEPNVGARGSKNRPHSPSPATPNPRPLPAVLAIQATSGQATMRYHASDPSERRKSRTIEAPGFHISDPHTVERSVAGRAAVSSPGCCRELFVVCPHLGEAS
jgi:hypothetical protein